MADAEFIHLAIQAGESDAQNSGGGVLIEVALFEGVENVTLLEGSQGDAEVEGSSLVAIGRGGFSVVVQPSVLPDECPLKEESFEAEDEFVGGDGFFEEVLGPGTEDLDDQIELLALALHEDDDIRRGGVGLSGEDFAADSRKEKLHDDGFDGAALKHLERLITVGAGDSREPRATKRLKQFVSKSVVGFDNHDRGGLSVVHDWSLVASPHWWSADHRAGVRTPIPTVHRCKRRAKGRSESSGKGRELFDTPCGRFYGIRFAAGRTAAGICIRTRQRRNMAAELLKTPLHEIHLERGGKMVDFAGWEMPVQFTGIVEEHNHTRTACSVFDVSHMGRLRLVGDDAEALLERVCTRKLAGAEGGRSFYSHICREDGGILDDVIVSRFANQWGVVCNASNRAKITAWLQKHAAGKKVQILDETMTTAMIACQGPKTMDLAKELTGSDLSGMKRYHFSVREVGPMQVVTYRSGYTGEDGLEIVLPAPLVKPLLPRLLGTKEAPHPVIRPAGLGARDTLRMEAAMPLYGHELGEEVDSLTAGQSWCVDLNKDFIGAEAMRKLQREGLKRKLVGLEVEGRRIARQHFKVLRGGRSTGEVTSGTLSPTLGKSIAMAFVGAEDAVEGTALEVEISGKSVPAKVVKLPFYKRSR